MLNYVAKVLGEACIQILRCIIPACGLGALFRGRDVKPLLIGSSLMLFQQITGQPCMLVLCFQGGTHKMLSHTIPAGGLGALFRGNNVRPLLIGSSLMLFQQITGQPSVLYYAAKIFKDAGFASDADATRVSVVLGFFKLVMTGELRACHDNMYMLLMCCAMLPRVSGMRTLPQTLMLPGCLWFLASSH